MERERSKDKRKGSRRCSLKPVTAESGGKSHSMQVADQIKQIHVSRRIGLIAEGPSITITNTTPPPLDPQHLFQEPGGINPVWRFCLRAGTLLQRRIHPSQPIFSRLFFQSVARASDILDQQAHKEGAEATEGREARLPKFPGSRVVVEGELVESPEAQCRGFSNIS